MFLQTARIFGLAGLAGLAGFSGHAAAQSIYTCVDGRGRKVTADRPIAECTDRAQQELTPSGLFKRQLGPSLTAHEQAVQDEKARLAAEARAREAEDKRRDRALVQRYPTRAVHDQDRAATLAQIDVGTEAASHRAGELAEQRKAIASEFEFYLKDPAKVPASLKQRLGENEDNVSMQRRFVAEQEQRKKRINLRFDEEMDRLRQLWATTGAPPGTTAASSAGKNSPKN